MTAFDLRPNRAMARTLDGDGWLAASHAAVQTVLREPGWSTLVTFHALQSLPVRLAGQAGQRR